MSTAATRASIKRATKAARAQLQTITDAALDRLRQAYARAVASIGQQIDIAGPNGSVALDNLRELLGAVEQRLAELSGVTARELNVALGSAAANGMAPFGASLIVSSQQRIAEEALRFVQNFVAADGLQLSDRLWNLNSGIKAEIVQALESAIIQGHGASRAAQDFLNRGAAVPVEISRKLSAGSTRNLRASVNNVLGADAPAYRTAQRLFRTELNRAHGQAYVATVEADEEAAGVRFRLGKGHPRVDICDMHASVNRFGLGAGVYPTGKHPWPAHPETLSYLEIVYTDEITAEDRAGKEDRITWLKRQSPVMQDGVLGSRKKRAALAQGLLSEGQIATPWNTLAERYKRQGVDVDALGRNLRAANAAFAPRGALPLSALASIDPAIAPAVNRALNAITQVHGVSGLQKSVPVVPNTLIGSEDSEGYHLYRLFAGTREIGLKRGTKYPEFVFAHEFGHLLDYQALGPKKGLPGSIVGTEFDELREVWLKSAAARAIAAKPGAFASYLLLPQELWARSYSQWLALRSGDRHLLAGVDWWLKANPTYPIQWTWDDFEPIAAAIDRMMKRKGWIQ